MITPLLFALTLLAPPAAPHFVAQDPPAPPPAQKGTEKKAEEPIEMPTLWVGDPAPPFAVAKWVHGAPVERLEAGKVYLIVLVGSSTLLFDDALAPITAVQERHAGKLTVLAAISDGVRPGPEKVEKYAKEHGAEMGFSLGYDKDSLLKTSWADAAKQVFAPNYFLVDRKSRIAWIGELEQIEPTLAQVLADKHDLKAAAERYRKDFTLTLRTRKHVVGIEGALMTEKWEKVIEHADALLAIAPVEYGGYAAARFTATAQGLKKLDDAYAFARAFAEGGGKDSATGLNAIAWTIVDPDQELERRDYDLALKAATRAVELTRRKDADILDTLAVAHLGRGELDKAVAVARESAVLNPEYQQRVAQIEAEIEARKGAK